MLSSGAPGHLQRLSKELCSMGALILDQCCWLPCLGWLVIGAINSVPDCRAWLGSVISSERSLQALALILCVCVLMCASFVFLIRMWDFTVASKQPHTVYKLYDCGRCDCINPVKVSIFAVFVLCMCVQMGRRGNATGTVQASALLTFYTMHGCSCIFGMILCWTHRSAHTYCTHDSLFCSPPPPSLPPFLSLWHKMGLISGFWTSSSALSALNLSIVGENCCEWIDHRNEL